MNTGVNSDIIRAAKPSFNQVAVPLQGETNPPISENSEKAIDLGAVAKKYFDGMTTLNKGRQIAFIVSAGLGLVALNRYVFLKDFQITEYQFHVSMTFF